MAMTRDQIVEQGKLHYQATVAKTPIAPPSFTYLNMDYDDAYAIEGVMVEEYIKNGYTVSGKKVGLTSNAMRHLAGIDEPDYGIIFHEAAFVNESTVPYKRFVQPAIEAELAFVLKKDLEGDKITVEDVLEATEYVVPCLEIVDIRQTPIENRKIFDSIADNASFGGYVLGDTPIMPYQADFGLVGFVFEYNNNQVEVSSGAAILDHPANSIAWLARKFTELGNPLKKGELVLAGSAIAALPADQGDCFRCRYGKWGDVSVRFA